MGAEFYHCRLKAFSRSAGKAVVACAAYRAGMALQDERYGTVRDFSRKSDVVETFTVAPEGAPAWASDIHQLWNQAEARERRKDSILSYEWEVALPHELAPETRLAIARAFSGWLVEQYGVGVTVGIHDGGNRGNGLNDHMHVMMTARGINDAGFEAKKYTCFNVRPGTPNPEVDRVREQVADLINDALEDAGSDARVDHRSFKTRGIEREPTRHLGPAATAYERQGYETDRGDINREILEDRLRWQQEQAQPEIHADLERDLAARFGDAELSAAYQAETERVAGLIAEARAGASVPADVVEHATAGMEPVDEDTASGGRNPPTVPIGWISRMKRLAAELIELLRDEGGEPSIDRLQADAPQPDMPAVEAYPGAPDAGHVSHHGGDHHADHHTDHPTGWQVHLKTAGEKLKGFADQVRQRAGTFIGNQRGSVPDFDPLPQADSFAEIFSAWLDEAGDGQENDLMNDGLFPAGSFPDEPDVPPDTPEPEPDDGLDYDL